MSYDPDSAEAKKGALGEEIIKKFVADKALPVQLWIADPSVGKIFIGNLSSEKNSLEHKQYIDCKEFPFDQETKFGLMHYYHQKQFSIVYDIDIATLKRLLTDTVNIFP